MSKNNYFKGWYFKCYANDTTITFIPAYHLVMEWYAYVIRCRNCNVWGPFHSKFKHIEF